MTPAHGASTDDVVAWLLGDGHLSCVDEDGRPIGEQGSPLYASLPQDERVRAFGDARDASGLSCNHTALLQIRAAWPAILATHAALENDRPSTHQRILRRTLSATSLAALASLRAPGVPIGRELAAFYKVSIGFSELCAGLLLEGAIDADDRPVPDERLFAWLDERKLLVGQRQVCAGTRAQIRRMWSALGEASPATSLAPIAEASAAWSRPAFDAMLELAVLAAAAAGAARMHVLRGGQPAREPAREPARSACLRLYGAPRVPRLCETLRRTADAGPLHLSLLFGVDDVPASLRAFVSTLPPPAEDARFLSQVDALLLQHARPVALRLMQALDRAGAPPLSLEAFTRACAG